MTSLCADLADLDARAEPEAHAAYVPLFQRHRGGVQGADGAGEVYFLGIIDILQLYNSRKQLVRVLRVWWKGCLRCVA